MLRRCLIPAVLIAMNPVAAWAGPKEDAEAVFGRFLAAFTAADPATVVDQFWPDALFWGTTMTGLATTRDAVQAYFAPLANRASNERRATAESVTSAVLSDTAVLVSGVWRVEAAGQATPSLLRVSMVVTCRDDAWRIAQFHNSQMPRP